MEEMTVDETRAANFREREELKRMGEEIAEVSARIDAAQWKLLSLIRSFDSRGGWEGALTCAHWLSWRIGLDLGAAREKVRVARALGRLSLIDDAMRRGLLSYSKVRAITRVATAENQEALVHMARNATGSQMERIGRAYRRVLVQYDDGRMEQPPSERWIRTRHLGFGMVCIEAQLPAEEAEVVVGALDAIRYAAKESVRTSVAVPAADDAPAEGNVSAETDVAPDGDDTLDGDVTAERGAARPLPLRTSAQQAFDRADALVALAESVLQSPAAIRAPGRPRHEVVVHVDADALADASDSPATLEDGTGISPETARRLSCDAPIVKLVVDGEGNPLDVGRRTRAIPPAMRRALQKRDGGCRFPGCTHSHFVDGHHVEHWAKGGETRLDNLVLLCRHHHRLVHEGGYSVVMEGKEPAFFDPDGRRLDGSPYVPRFDDPIGLDRFAGFLSWLDAQEHASTIETPPPPDCYPWDFGLCVDVLVQRYEGPPPPLDTDAARRRAPPQSETKLAA